MSRESDRARLGVRFAPSGLERALQIGQSQQSAIADPGLRELRFGLSGRVSIAARLVKLGETVIRPSVARRPFERAPELILGFVEPAGLHQRGRNRLTHGIVTVK